MSERPRSPIRRYLALLLMQALFAQSAYAQPETSVERARLARESGKSAFDAGDYAQALQSYQEAFAIDPDPRLHFNLAATHDKLLDVLTALVHYYAFLAAVSAQPGALEPYGPSIMYARDRARVLEQTVSTLELRSEENWPVLTIQIDGDEPQQATLPLRLRIAAGTHEIVAKHPDGRRWARSVRTSPGVHSAIEVTFLAPFVRETNVEPVPVPLVPPRSLLGVGARSDVDMTFRGAGYAVFARYALWPRLRVGAGGFMWPAAGDTVWGASLTAAPNIELFDTLRLLGEVEGELYARAGMHTALRIGLALEWAPLAALRFAAGMSVFITTARVVAENAVFPAASLAVEVWL